MNLPLEALASVHSRGEKSPHLDAAETWTRALLAAIPDHEQWTTRQLIAHLLIPDSDQLTKKRLSQTLWHLRRLGKLEDCYATDETRRWYGNPLILWRNPKTEGIF